MSIKVLFVCLGNICRSPAAEGILQQLVEKEGLQEKIHVESCGLGEWHLGLPADVRMRNVALERGISLTSKAKLFNARYFDEFNYILAADHEVLEILHTYAKTIEHKAKLHLFTAFAISSKNKPIGDPYYLGDAAFYEIFDMMEDACEGLIEYLKKEDLKIN